MGVLHGSVLGPLIFLLFINDLPYFLKEFLTILFADDTSLGLDDINYNDLLNRFKNAAKNLINWCKFNKLDINWKKSEIMFVTNKQNIIIPEFIEINGNQIKVVSEFKLLGIIIDNKLNFIKKTCRLYSIQKLLQLYFNF